MFEDIILSEFWLLLDLSFILFFYYYFYYYFVFYYFLYVESLEFTLFYLIFLSSFSTIFPSLLLFVEFSVTSKLELFFSSFASLSNFFYYYYYWILTASQLLWINSTYHYLGYTPDAPCFFYPLPSNNIINGTDDT